MQTLCKHVSLAARNLAWSENMVKQCPTCAKCYIPWKEPVIPTDTRVPMVEGWHRPIPTQGVHLLDRCQLLFKIPRDSKTLKYKLVWDHSSTEEYLLTAKNPRDHHQWQWPSVYSSRVLQILQRPTILNTWLAALTLPKAMDKLSAQYRWWRSCWKSPKHMALLMYCSTPFQWCNLSPAELLTGRRLRSNVPYWANN